MFEQRTADGPLFLDPFVIPPWRVEAGEAVARRVLTPSESLSFSLLVVRLRYAPDAIQANHETGTRVIRETRTLIYEDGYQMSPLEVQFHTDDDRHVVIVDDVMPLPSTEVVMMSGTATSAIAALTVAA